MKNAFFMFSGIRIDGHLTKKLELLRISCHLVVVNRHSSQSDLYLIALSSGRENHQKTKKSNILDFVGFFYRFGSNQAVTSVFNFVIFEEIGSRTQKIWENPWSGSGH